MRMPSPQKTALLFFKTPVSSVYGLAEIAKDILIQSNKRPRSSALDSPSQPCSHAKESSSASPHWPTSAVPLPPSPFQPDHKCTPGPGTLSSGSREHTCLEPYCVPSARQCSQKHVSNRQTIGKLPDHRSARTLKGTVTDVQGHRVSARLSGKKNKTDFVELLPSGRHTVLVAFTCHVTECSHHPSKVSISSP